MTFKLCSFHVAPRFTAASRTFVPGRRTVGLIAAASLYLALPIKKAALILFTAAGGLIGLGATIYEIVLAVCVLNAMRRPEPGPKRKRMQLKASEARP